MKREDVYSYFGGRIAAAKALRVTPSALTKWGEEVPKGSQYFVELVMQEEQRKRDAQGRDHKKARKTPEEVNSVQRPEPQEAQRGESPPE